MKKTLLILIFCFLFFVPRSISFSQDRLNLKAEVATILDIFAKEELGNRLSQFAMISLKQMILEKIDQYEKQLEEEKGGGDEN